MTRNRSFFRKLIYCCAIAVLLAPVSWLSAPATSGSATRPASVGGKLAQLRGEYQLSQASLGEIDPASETIKLATLGMRGVAATMLWQKAHRYKMTEDWTGLSTTLEQITKLQPNFVAVWQYQSWNLSYNVSAQFDDFHDRYYWVIRGLKFLEEGTEYNRDNPNLLWDMGWFLGHKIGQSDEKEDFRILFREDDEYHPPDRPRELRDNWLLGKQWFLKSQEAHDTTGKPIKGRTDLIFHMYPALWQSYYASWLEHDGVFSDVARRAWEKAADDWRQYGERPIPVEGSFEIQLGRLEYYQEQAATMRARLETLAGDRLQALRDERAAALSDEHRRALDLDAETSSEAQKTLSAEAEELLVVPVADLVQAVIDTNPAAKVEAYDLQREIANAEKQVELIETNRPHMNFDYWTMRAEFEQLDEAILAREYVYKGDEAQRVGFADKAREFYDLGMAEWRKVLDRYPEIVYDPITGDEFMQVIARYDYILTEAGDPFPADFPLRDVVEWHDQEGKYRGKLGATDAGTEAEEPESSTEPIDGLNQEPPASQNDAIESDAEASPGDADEAGPANSGQPPAEQTPTDQVE